MISFRKGMLSTNFFHFVLKLFLNISLYFGFVFGTKEEARERKECGKSVQGRFTLVYDSKAIKTFGETVNLLNYVIWP